MWTTNDPDVKPVINDLVRYVQEQPEHLTGSGWHRQGYVEFSKRLNSGAVREALGFPTKKMGTKSGKLYRLQLREGTQAQAMMYCSSTWYCCGEKCHVGDATELRDRFLVFGGTRLREAGSCFTQDAEPADTSEWKDHSECPEFTVKGKVGFVVCLGIPVPQGREADQAMAVKETFMRRFLLLSRLVWAESIFFGHMRPTVRSITPGWKGR